MPQVTVYVREDDLDLWKAIERKSEWLSNHLNGEYPEESPVGLKPPTSKQIIQKAEMFAGNSPLCDKHDMPIDTRGKCMLC